MFILFKKMLHTGVQVCASHAPATYEEAVKALNGLQSNALRLINRMKDPDSMEKLKNIEKYLDRTGINLDRLDNLSVIHVAGTKGKGSTCVFTESLLRAHGIKTGVFTSPHLVSVRERLRINGKPIDENTFAKYFFKVYHTLDSKREHDCDMPSYFMFLTILMFHLFLESSIDVAIIEVGIGGEYDVTNIVRKPICVGITSLGLEHTSLLGNNIREIAYHKSGIFKRGVPAFSAPQPAEARTMLEERAREKGCSLSFAPPLESYDWRDGKPPVLGMTDEFQSLNASLAIIMASTWLRSKLSDGEAFSFDRAALALSSCKLSGRAQLLRGRKSNFYLDVAHTIESIESCSSWFREATKNSTGKRILVFNMTGDRDPVEGLKILKSLNFDKAFFVPNIAGKIVVSDQINRAVSDDEQMLRCRKHCDIWGDGSVSLANVSQAIEQIRNDDESSIERSNVLFTGSVHLVGAALATLDPDLTMCTEL